MAMQRTSNNGLNRFALAHFSHQHVSHQMISYLAKATSEVISHNSLVPCSSPFMPRRDSCQLYRVFLSSHDPNEKWPGNIQKGMPTLEQFIFEIVRRSNVQVPTLMSTLVYLGRLKSRYRPAPGCPRCAPYSIFLCSLILAAKYLNDESPMNKQWALYSCMIGSCVWFGLNHDEVNKMEIHLLHLLDWELGISEQDLYRELDFFLEPIRTRACLLKHYGQSIWMNGTMLDSK